MFCGISVFQKRPIFKESHIQKDPYSKRPIFKETHIFINVAFF